jgi:phosphate transport system permease protein
VVKIIRKEWKEKFYFKALKASAFISVAILSLVIIFIFLEGSSVISFKFLTENWSNTNIKEGGIFPAIIGSLFLGILVAISSIPIGILTAVYLNEYSKDTWLTRIIKLSIRNLAGVPSIVYGLFGFAFFLMSLRMGTSLLAASLTLGCMTLPWIITTSDEALKSIPDSFREGSYALGATKSQTIWKNVLPHSLSGMLTGSILGVSRAIGETAPIILVGATFYMDYVSFSPFEKFMALPYHLFVLATQHSSSFARTYAAGTALVLIILIFSINVWAFAFRHRLRMKKDW